MMKLCLKTSLILSIGILFAACSHKGDLDAFDNKFYQNNMKDASSFAREKSDGGEDLLWSFNAGVSQFWDKRAITSQDVNATEEFALAQDSNATQDDNATEEKQSALPLDTLGVLEASEVLFSKYETEGLMSGVFSNVGATMSNDNVMDYRGNIYEGALLNYYKALENLSLGKVADARVEFNRANDRQRRAKDYYAKDIAKAQEEQDKENAGKESLRNVDTKSPAQSIISERYSNIDSFGAYAGFINPSISYVSALFYMLNNDYNKALDYYKESYGITKAEIVNDDIKLMDNRKSGKDKNKYTWAIIEDGKGVHKQEDAFNIMVGIYNVGMALPKLVDGIYANNSYIIKGADTSYSAYEIGNLSSVASNEFYAQLPSIVARAIASTTTKVVMQVGADAMKDEVGGIAGALISLGARAYSIATTGADVRNSTILPHKTMVLKIPNKEGIYTIQGDGENKKIDTFEIQDCDIATSNVDQNQTTKKENITKICKNNDNILYLRVLPSGKSVLKIIK